ncbi:uncharacterized protein LOC110975945 [Acanthaster planci]|uniref:Uncharacterized protein LOC110975945 n=1 Tax=Acanthaster planci TaxID=133434 RepID=A0A8B7XUJ7_ACAPL|nr:uncharacterized protein LOC110975945 [Acanthaster planci]XP_022084524.1 uncharacterized protein LOC110975945 [Acanthaster planci]
MKSPSGMTIVVILGTLLYILTPPVGGAAVGAARLPRAEPQPTSSSTDYAQLALLRFRAIRDLIQGLQEVQESFQQRAAEGSLLDALGSMPKCGAVGESCDLYSECCPPLMCHHHTRLDLSKPNSGRILGFCGARHTQR